MPLVELTDRFVKAAKPVDGARQTEFFDGIVRGLSLLASGGSRAFYFHYTRQADGKRARMKLGTYPEMSLAQARERARGARAEVGGGKDPAAEKRALAASATVGDLVETYITRHASQKRTAEGIARRLRRDVSDVIGDVKLSELHRRDLVKCIDAVQDRGAPVGANRTFQAIRALVRWARAHGDLDTNPIDGMRRPTEIETPRDRVLSTDEIHAVWAALPAANVWESTRRVLRLCLVTGQRVGEIVGMARAELDFEARVWTIPSARAKNAQVHRVPLSDMALYIIREQLDDVDALDSRKGRPPSPFLFPGPGARAATTGAAIAKAVKRQLSPAGRILGVEPWTPHDLRRTMATHIEELGVSPLVVGHLLNHISITKAGITSRVYARYDYGREKREALELWADRLAAIVEVDAKVVSLVSAAR